VLPEYRDEWTPMTPAAIMARINELAGGKPVLVSLSGGNPVADCGEGRGGKGKPTTPCPSSI
jgi:organic radical activating enzyme